jgi:hypothetical protein
MTVEAGRLLLKRIDDEIEKVQQAGESDNKPRYYCGASAIGEECARARYYDYRWASDIRFEGRMLRLFDRGHQEEKRVLAWLGLVGVEIRATSKRLMYHEGSDSYVLMDWDIEQDVFSGPDFLDEVTDLPWHVERAEQRGVKLEQWGFVAHGGHFRGHSDGKLRFVPGQELFVPPDEWIGFECKTHGDSSFAELAGAKKNRDAWLASPDALNFPGKKVEGSKPEHVIQAQHYMHHLGLRLTLYAAVNKNTDDIHFEFIQYDPKYHIDGEPIIRETIHSPRLPRRISKNPSWFKCKMCDHRKVCHFGEPMQKNCRTCVYSHAAEEGNWRCRKWNDAVIPKEAQLGGCGEWIEIKDQVL